MQRQPDPFVHNVKYKLFWSQKKTIWANLSKNRFFCCWNNSRLNATSACWGHRGWNASIQLHGIDTIQLKKCVVINRNVKCFCLPWLFISIFWISANQTFPLICTFYQIVQNQNCLIEPILFVAVNTFSFFVNLSWFGLNQSNIFFLSGGDWVLNIKSAARGTLIEKFKPARQHNQPAQAKLDK